jgi:hypothetical protein
MKHFTYDQWLEYVKNDINEKLRKEFESHLYTCDQCLELYLKALEVHESSLPILTNQSGFTDLVIHEVSKQKVYTEKPAAAKTSSKKPFYQQVVFHYFLAAAVTQISFTLRSPARCSAS